MHYKIITKLAYLEKPDENDRQILELFFGKKITDLTIAKAYQIRKDLRKKSHIQLEGKRIMQEYDNKLDTLKDNLHSSYGNKFKSNELLTDLMINFS